MLLTSWLSGLVSGAAAETVCVQGGGREACVTDTVYAFTGVRVWSMWTENFRQSWRLTPAPGIDRFELTSFECLVGDSARDWCQGGPFTGEYELKYGWAADAMTQVFDGPNWEDGLEFVDAAMEQGEQDGIPYVQLSPRFRHVSQPLEIRLVYRAYLDGYLERWARATNAAESDTTLFVRHLVSARHQFSPVGWISADSSRWCAEWVRSYDVASFKSAVMDSCLELRSWGSSDWGNCLAWCAAHYDTRCDTTWCRGEGFVMGLVQASGAQEWPSVTSLVRPLARAMAGDYVLPTPSARTGRTRVSANSAVPTPLPESG